jgi:hypothetical protein
MPGVQVRVDLEDEAREVLLIRIDDALSVGLLPRRNPGEGVKSSLTPKLLMALLKKTGARSPRR